MKIFNNRSSSGSGGGSGVSGSPGDVFFSYNYIFGNPKVANITDFEFSGTIEEYPDLDIAFVQSPPTLAGLPVTEYIDNTNLPYPCELYDMGTFFYATGKSIFNPNDLFINKIIKSPTENQFNKITLPFTASSAKAIFDGVDTFYIYNIPVDNSLITEAIKFNIETLEQTTLTLKPKRIAQAYFAEDIQKFVVHEVNAIDDTDHDANKNGIFYYDNFDDVQVEPNIIVDKYKVADIQVNGMYERLKRSVLRKKNGVIVYVDDADKKLKDIETATEIFSIVGQDGTSTNISKITSIMELYDKIFIQFVDLKDADFYSGFACLQPDNSVLYAYAYNMNYFSVDWLIFDHVYNSDFTSPDPFSPAVIYNTAGEGTVRQALTFSADPSKQYLFENINTVNATDVSYLGLSYLSSDYYKTYKKENDDYNYYIYDMYGFVGMKKFNVLDVGFNGFGLPYIYIPPLKVGNLQTYLIIKK